jgi:S-adenosyl-L-methionine hydrolase (adenosine-forming)
VAAPRGSPPGLTRRPVPRITLLTDFGTGDGYVGAMKGVIASIHPGAVLDDITHDVPPGDVGGASLRVGRYWNRWPPGTVHLVVVDPGVGTERRALALEADQRFLVLPDNGVGSRVLGSAREWRAVELREAAYRLPGASGTFHGRDVFAPAAAHLAEGVPLSRLGPPVTDPVRLVEPDPTEVAGGTEGEVISVDRFGNLVTNLPGELARGAERVVVAGRNVPIGGVYGEAGRGSLIAVVNSDDRIEVALRDGSAARELGLGVGAPVRLPRPGAGGE